MDNHQILAIPESKKYAPVAKIFSSSIQVVEVIGRSRASAIFRTRNSCQFQLVTGAFDLVLATTGSAIVTSRREVL